MKRVVALTVVSFVVFAVGLVLIGSAYAQVGFPQVTGRTFRVTVKSSAGATFIECFRFDRPNPGDLTLDQLPLGFRVVTYRHGQLDTVDTRFKAVSRTGAPFAVMFFGEEIEALEQLTGEAVNEFGITFVFSGPETGPSTSPELCVAPPGHDEYWGP